MPKERVKDASMSISLTIYVGSSAGVLLRQGMLNEANDEIFRKELEDISQDLSKATRLRASLKLSMGF